MNLDKKDILIVVLCIALIIVQYIAFTPKPTDNYEQILNSEIKRLNALNKQAIKEIENRDIKIEKFTLQIDSLQNLKPKIQKEYVSKYKEISDANANSVVNEFKLIFANAGIN